MTEREWKHLRTVAAAALERFCERVLRECAEISNDAGRTAHQRYLALYRLTRTRDDELANAFNDLRRSNALHRLAWMRSLGVVTEEEWAGFDPGTRDTVEFLMR